MSRKAPNPPRSGPRPAPPPPPPATSDVAKHTAWVGEIVEQWIHEMPDVAVLTRWYEQTYYRVELTVTIRMTRGAK